MASNFDNTQPVVRELELSPGKWVKLTFTKEGITSVRKGDKTRGEKKSRFHTWQEVLAGDVEFLFNNE